MVKILDGIATGLTILAAVRTAIEIAGIVQSSRNQKSDYDKLKLRLDVEQCRLHKWTQAVGIEDVVLSGQDRPIDNLRFADAVRDILASLVPLLDHAEMIKDRYRSSRATAGNMLSEHQQQIPSVIQVKENVIWVVRDRRTFSMLVAEMRELLNRLEDITKSPASTNVQVAAKTQERVEANETKLLDSMVELSSKNKSDIAMRQQYASTYDPWSQSISDTWIPRTKVPRYRGSKL